MIFCGDSLEVLRTLPDESVQCCVTSPPYWGLRDYGVEGQIGLEKNLSDHLEKIVSLFREVRRILRPNGVIWVNYGDVYVSPTKGRNGDGTHSEVEQKRFLQGSHKGSIQGVLPRVKYDLPLKNLIGLPWRVAFALQDDGWILRSEIIWHKTNAMPESAKDRPGKAHEHLFLLAKNPKYYFDHEAIKERRTEASIKKNKVKSLIVHKKENMPGREGVRDYSRRGWGSDYTSELRNSRTVWEIPTQPTKEKHFATFPDELVRRCIAASTKPGDLVIDPFLGSGTTYKVALELGCKAIGIELNPDYIKIAEHKISSIHPLFQ